MKLKEKLKELKGKQVKLGSRVSFVYCDVVDDNILNNLQRLSEKELQKIIDFKIGLENHLKNFEVFWKDKVRRNELQLKNDMLKVCQHKKIKFKEKDYLKKVIELQVKLKHEKEKDYNTTISNIKRYNKRISEFTPFTEREVVDIYESTYNDGTLIVKFVGEEQGDYWFREEYVRDNV